MGSPAKRSGSGGSKAKGGRSSLPESSRLFKLSPVSAWEEDFSRIKKRLDDLKNEGIKDFRRYFNNHPAEVISLARKVRIIDVNDATIRLYQARSKAELRRGLHLVFNKESYDVFREELIALAEGKAEFTSEAITKTLKGNERHVLLTLSVPTGCLDSLAHVFVSIVDITDLKESEKELRESEEKYRTIVESVPEPILVTDAETGIILEANRSAEGLLGISGGQIVGMHFRQVFSREETESRGNIIQNHLEDEASIPENAVIFRKTGERIPVSIHSSHIGIQERRCVLIVFQEKDREPARTIGPGSPRGPVREQHARHEELEKLSRREKDVIRLVASGLTNRQIAGKLFISIKTVETHRARIMDKLGLHKAADIVRFAIYKGLLENASPDG
jgi:PAS domain S-box-containing protein